MSRYLITAPVFAVAAAAAPVSAQAQDAGWTGFYVGAHGALVENRPEWNGVSIYQTIVDGGEGNFTTGTQSEPFSAKPSESEIGGGARVGFNWQIGGFVLGAEADATFFDYNGVAADTQGPATYALVSHATNLQTIRARAGVALGPALLFATGGIAFSDLKHTLTAANTSQVLVDGGEGGTTIGTSVANLAGTAGTSSGWTVGGGGELRVTDRLSLALTVLHADFGSESLIDSSTPSSITSTVDSTLLLGMLGVNFRF